MKLLRLHTLFIINTKPGAIVTYVEIYLCNLTFIVTKVITGNKNINEKLKVHINTKILKHLYDKKPAQEYDSILKFADQITKYPDIIYLNNDSKRGDFLFVKEIESEKWLCSIENQHEKYYLVTCFRLRKESYLNNYTLIWSWKDGLPSS